MFTYIGYQQFSSWQQCILSNTEVSHGDYSNHFNEVLIFSLTAVTNSLLVCDAV